MRNAHQSAKKYKAARQDRDGRDGAPQPKCSRARVSAGENIDTSEQTRALGQPREKGSVMRCVAGQAGCTNAMVLRGLAAMGTTKEHEAK